MSAHGLEAALAGFIGGVTVASVIGWVFRDRIRARMIRSRR